MTEPQYDAEHMDNFYLAEENRALRAQRDELLTAAKAVVWWNKRVDAMCEREDVRDVLQPLLAAIAKAEGRTDDNGPHDWDSFFANNG